MYFPVLGSTVTLLLIIGLNITPENLSSVFSSRTGWLALRPQIRCFCDLQSDFQNFLYFQNITLDHYKLDAD